MLTLESKDLIHSLASGRCPACGKGKQPRNTFCAGCYYKLPARMRPTLYRRLGNGYEESVAQAMQILKRSEFLMPQVPPSSPGPSVPGSLFAPGEVRP